MKKIILPIFLLLCVIVNAQNKKNKSTPGCGPTIANTKNIKMKNLVKKDELNVLGSALQIAGTDPMTGFYRDGFCSTGVNDAGIHVVAAIVTKEFLLFSKKQGNDLITPYPASNFKGLKAGDKWCLCVQRWKQAYDAGVAPPVVLEATHVRALDFVTIEELKSVLHQIP
jgi:uncharacterized protein